MTHLRWGALAVLLGFALGCSSEPAPSNSTDAGPSDTGSVTDTGPVDAGPADAGPSRCGSETPDVSAIRRTEGLVVGRDGTLYYSQANAVGRLRPGMEPEARWAVLPGSTGTVWGMVIDPSRSRLYVGSPSAGRIFAVTLEDTPTVTTYVPSAGQPNGLTLGPDGALYYSDFGGNQVYRVPPDGMRAAVTTSAIAQANGVAFGPDGNLYVCSYGAGTVLRLTLTDGAETARAVAVRGVGSPDGIAFDSMGRMLITDNGMGRLLRADADGSNVMTLRSGISSAASLDFGVGALRCSDLFIASGGAMVRYEYDGMGATVPWQN
ncbi:MAG: SMP-30/gluconolactonase/LRE family protein [Myxococcales bacterium]|nr:SMP-30/gluconolactonase/LRE family protein [Myxococcales bacterium]